MLAIVLSGGGAKGAYQAGCYKAFKKLGIKYDIVTGTSIGALNGFLMVQGDLKRCLRLWENVSFSQIYDDFDEVSNEKEIYDKYLDKIIHGGIKTDKIEEFIAREYNAKKLYRSRVKYGVVSFNLSKMRPVMATKDKMDAETLKKYVIASAICFPFFKPSKIDNEIFIDGGYYDNMPVNLAIELGATEVITVDLRAVGLRQSIKDKDVKVTNITPNNKLSSFLIFDKNEAKKMIKFGYNDTMKVFKKLDGKKYTFKKNNLLYNYNRYNNKFVNLTRHYVEQNKSILKLFNKLNDVEHVINRQNIMSIMNKNIEGLGNIFEIDETKIYDIRLFNMKLLNALNKTSLVQEPKGERQLIKYIYENLNDKFDKKVYNTICLYPKEFLMAIYLKCITKGSEV